MNRSIKKWVSPAIALAIALFCVPLFGAKKLVDRIVVTVNEDAILESDIEDFQRKIKAKSYQELLGIDPRMLQTRESIIQLLIEEKIIDQQVKKLDLKATDQEVDGQIKSILRRNGIQLAQLTERLKQLGTSMADYRDGIRRQIERRNLIDREIKPTLESSEEQLRHFYLRNKRPDDNDTQFKIAHILISPKPGAAAGAQKVRVDTVYQEINQHPEKFAEYAKQYSDDSTTSDSGGVLGFYSMAALAKEFRSAVPKTEPGKVTAPIETKAGFHIIKVLETRSSDFSMLSKEQKEQIRNQMQMLDLEKHMTLWLERKKAEAHVRSTSEKNNVP